MSDPNVNRRSVKCSGAVGADPETYTLIEGNVFDRTVRDQEQNHKSVYFVEIVC